MKLKRPPNERLGTRAKVVLQMESHRATLNERLGINKAFEEREFSYLDIQFTDQTAENVSMQGISAGNLITLLPEKEALLIEKMRGAGELQYQIDGRQLISCVNLD